MRPSIRWKLTLFVCGPLIAINGALLAWDYSHQKDAAIEQMSSLITDKARASADQLSARLDSFMQIADSIAPTLNAHSAPSEPQLHTAALEPMRQSPFIIACAVIPEPGGAVAPRIGAFARRIAGGVRQLSLSELMPPGQPDPAWYTEARQTLEPQWCVGSIGTQAARLPVVWYAAPWLEGEHLRGVVAVAIRAQALQLILAPRGHMNPARTGPGERARGRAQNNPRARSAAPAPEPAPPAGAPGDSTPLAENPENPVEPGISGAEWTLASQFGPDGYFIVDREQRIVSHPDLARIDTPLFTGLETARDPASARRAWSEMLEQPHGAVPVHLLDDEVPGLRPDSAHWVAFAHIPAAKWIFATTIPQSLVIAPIVDHLRHRAALLLAGVLAVALVIILVSFRVCRPIEGLARAVERLAGGDLEARVEGVRSRDEIGTLAEGFNSMVVRLKEKIAALARETAAREGIESELRIARQIQQDLLPRPTPAFVGRTDFDLHAVNVPARRVAGDFYDYFFVGDKLLIVIADVSGKGMPAALLMAVARTVVRDFASLNLSPAQIVAHANQTIFDGSDDSMFVTMFLAQYQPTTGGLTYVCAGHPPPYILSPSRSPSHLGRPTAPLLGVFDGCEVDLTIRQEERTLQPGETLFLYTDGVTDARSPGGRMVNEEGLVRAFARLGTFDARSLCERVLAGLQAHEQGGQADDITMLALRRTNGDNSAGDPAPAGSDGAPPI